MIITVRNSALILTCALSLPFMGGHAIAEGGYGDPRYSGRAYNNNQSYVQGGYADPGYSGSAYNNNQTREQRRASRQQEREQRLALRQEKKKENEGKQSEKYLKKVAKGTRLIAVKCPDGEGKYYATGKRPDIKPEVVSCVDVYFRAYCRGSTQYSEGIARNFIGMSGCFGDTYDINPKPACKVEDVKIDVLEARGGCGS